MSEAGLALALLYDLYTPSKQSAPLSSASFQPSLSRVAAFSDRLRILERVAQVKEPKPLQSLALGIGIELQRLRTRFFAYPLPRSLLRVEVLISECAAEVTILEHVVNALMRDDARQAKSNKVTESERVALIIDATVCASEMGVLNGGASVTSMSLRMLTYVMQPWLAILEAWLLRGDTCTFLPFALYAPAPSSNELPCFMHDTSLIQLLGITGNAAALAPLSHIPLSLCASLTKLLFAPRDTPAPVPKPSTFFSAPALVATPSPFSFPCTRTVSSTLAPFLRHWLHAQVRLLATPRTHAALHAVRETYTLEQHLSAIKLGALVSAPSLHLYFASHASAMMSPLAFADAARDACGTHASCLRIRDDGYITCDLPPALAALLMPPETQAIYEATSRLLIRLLTARTLLSRSLMSLLRREQLLWLQSVETYVRQTVIEPSWAQLERSVQSAESSEQLGTAHATFATHVRDRLFLSAKHTPLRARIDALLLLCESSDTNNIAWRAEARLLVGVLSRAAALRHAPHLQELLGRFDLMDYYLQEVSIK